MADVVSTGVAIAIGIANSPRLIVRALSLSTVISFMFVTNSFYQVRIKWLNTILEHEP